MQLHICKAAQTVGISCSNALPCVNSHIRQSRIGIGVNFDLSITVRQFSVKQKAFPHRHYILSISTPGRALFFRGGRLFGLRAVFRGPAPSLLHLTKHNKPYRQRYRKGKQVGYRLRKLYS